MEHILKLKPVLKDYIWGGHKLETLYGRNNGEQPVSESWEVSVHPDGLTTYEGGTFADYVAAHPYALDKEREGVSSSVRNAHGSGQRGL